MLKTSRLTAAYVLGVLLLSSIDVYYEWLEPLLDSETGQSINWCGVTGLRVGTVGVGSHEGGFPDGLAMDVHRPRFPPFLFYAGAGPESGVAVVAVWFLGLVAWTSHLLVRLLARQLRGRRLGTSGK